MLLLSSRKKLCINKNNIFSIGGQNIIDMNNLFSKNRDLIIILFILFLIIFFAILFTETLSFFKSNNEANGIVQLGELDYTINVSNISKNTVMPGDLIELDVNIENKVEGKNNLVPFYFRFKILKGEDDYGLDFIEILSPNNFIKDDNYCYYKYKLLSGQKATLINSIKIDEKFSNQEIDELNLSILIDAVQSEYGAYKEIFPDAPSEWVEFIENN